MEYLAIWVSIALASFVQGAVGFGYGIVATGLLAVLVDVTDASVIMMLGGLAQNATILARLWRHFTWQDVRGLLLPVIVGTPFGVSFLVLADSRWVLLGLGGLLMASTLRIGPTQDRPRPLPGIWTLPAGFVAGFLHGSFGAGAPPAVLYMRHQAIDRHRYVAGLQVVLGTATLTRAIFMGGYGLFRPELLVISLVGIIFAIVGAHLGVRVLTRVSPKFLELATNALLFALGAKYLLSAW